MSELVRRLCDVNGADWSTTWSSFLFNVRAVIELGYPKEAQAIITAGEQWRGEGWTTGRASKALYEVTGVPLVSANVEDYKGSFLYALALHWGLDIATFDLSERASDAAFALAAVFADVGPEGHEQQEYEEDEVDSDGGGSLVFAWEERLEPLPQELAVLWKRYGAKTTARFDTKQLLELAPRFDGLPARAAENNVLNKYEQSGHLGKFDKLAKVLQQHLLNSLRVQAKLYGVVSMLNAPGGEQATQATQAAAISLLQQHWAYTASQVAKLDVERKESVLPGSAAQDTEVLFGGDEVREVQGKRKLRDMRRGVNGPSGTATGPRYSFRAYPAGMGAGKGAKGQGGRHWGQGGKGAYPWSQGGKGRGKGAKGRGKGFSLPRGKSPSPRVCQGKVGKLGTDGRLARSADEHQQGCVTRLALPQPASSAYSSQPSRRSKSADYSGGLSPSRGFTGDSLFSEHQVFDSLVCDQQNRNLRRSEAQAHQRLQGPECSPQCPEISVGEHSTGFPSAEKGHVCHESRPKERLLPSGGFRKSKTVPLHAGGRKVLSVARGSFWPVHASISVPKHDENTAQKMEGKRVPGLDLPGRHSSGQLKPKNAAKAQGSCAERFGNVGSEHQLQKVLSGASPAGGLSRLPPQLCHRDPGGAPAEVENCEKGTGEIGNPLPPDPEKSGGYPRNSQKFPDSTSFSESVHRPTVFVCQSARESGLGHPPTSAKNAPGATQGRKRPSTKVAGSFNGGKKCHTKAPFRCFGPWLGRKRFANGRRPSRILEGPKRFTHQREGIVRCTANGEKLSKKGRKSSFGGGQFSGIQLHKEVRGKETSFQLPNATFPLVVQRTENFSGRKSGKKCTNGSGFSFQKKGGQRRLHSKQKRFSASSRDLLALYSTRFGRLCESRKCTVEKLGFEVPTFRSLGMQCAGNGPVQSETLLGKPTLEFNSTMAVQTQTMSLGDLPYCSPLVGWKFMVAPTSKTASEGDPSRSDREKVGLVQKLPGRENATYQMAPSLCSVIRLLLERKQIPNQSISLYLKPDSTLQRYEGAFKCFWAFATEKGFQVADLNVDQVASLLLQMSHINENQARHAYSACLLLPGFEALRFSSLLKKEKRKWNSHEAKYSTFWDAEKVLHLLIKTDIDWKSVKEVRNRLILVLRLLHLCRSVDLQRTLRTLSSQGDKVFILIKRKNELTFKWEELMKLPNAPNCCPTTLLLHYVRLTSRFAAPGSQMFRALTPPYAPLTAKSLGSVTKMWLHMLGVPTNIFGAHSTRGAAVNMFKRLGLSSDQVAQLGKWKNLEAFSKHYLRIGAVQDASEKLSSFVHTGVSQGACAEPAWSRTPGTDQGPGGSDHKGEAQEQCEPTPPPRKKRPKKRVASDSSSEASAPRGPKVFRFTVTRQPPSPSRSKEHATNENCT